MICQQCKSWDLLILDFHDFSLESILTKRSASTNAGKITKLFQFSRTNECISMGFVIPKERVIILAQTIVRYQAANGETRESKGKQSAEQSRRRKGENGIRSWREPRACDFGAGSTRWNLKFNHLDYAKRPWENEPRKAERETARGKRERSMHRKNWFDRSSARTKICGRLPVYNGFPLTNL